MKQSKKIEKEKCVVYGGVKNILQMKQGNICAVDGKTDGLVE